MGKINSVTIKILKIGYFSVKILKIEEEAYREWKLQKVFEKCNKIVLERKSDRLSDFIGFKVCFYWEAVLNRIDRLMNN